MGRGDGRLECNRSWPASHKQAVLRLLCVPGRAICQRHFLVELQQDGAAVVCQLG